MISKEELTDKIERVVKNLYDFLYSKDERYINNLVNELGRTPEEAKRLAAWDWTHGIGLYGLLKCYQFRKDDRYLDAIECWFRDRMEIGLPEKNVNTVAPLLTMAFLYEIRPDDRYREIMWEWACWIMHDMKRTKEGGIQHEHAELENCEELWDDTLIMSVLFLAKAGLLFDREDFVDEAVYQFRVHAKYLTDTKTGLWYHGWTFLERSNFAGALWGRGNCWVSVFIPDFLEMVEPGDAVRRYAEYALCGQAEALKKFQTEDGMWHTLIDDASTYQEASATAGFCYGILKGVRLGYLDQEYAECGEKALKAIMDHVSEDGELAGVSYGTNVGHTLQHYKDIPLVKMHYGQSLALLALLEGLRRGEYHV